MISKETGFVYDAAGNNIAFIDGDTWSNADDEAAGTFDGTALRDQDGKVVHHVRPANLFPPPRGR